MLKIFVTNLGKYNEGELVGKWVDLEDYGEWDDFEESAELASIGIGAPRWDGTVYEEWFVTDIDCDIPWVSYEEYPGTELFDEWCGSASLWADLDDGQKDVLYAYDGHDGVSDLSDAEDVLRRYRDGEIVLHEGCDKEDVVMQWYDQGVIFGGLDDDTREEMRGFIKWEYVVDEYGQELSETGSDVLEVRW